MSVLKDGFDILLGIRYGGLSSLCQSAVRWAKARTIEEWYAPHTAIEKFGSQEWLRRRAEDAEEDRHRGQELNASLPKLLPPEREVAWQRHMENVHRSYDLATNVLLEGLQRKLARGELIARAFRLPFTPGAPYVTIPQNEWRILELKMPDPDRVEVGGVGYVALEIGKPGTKSFFRRKR